METMEKTKYQEGIKSSLDFISGLIGEYDTTSIHSLGGLSMSGKTTLLLTLMYEYSHMTGKRACIFDTEAGAERFIKLWDKALKKRYPKAQTPLVFMARNLRQILRAHGQRLIMKISENGKVTPSLGEVMPEGKRYKDEVTGKILRKEAPEFIRFIRENNIGFVVYDSFTSPFVTEIPTGLENFPARAFIQGVWLRAIIDLVIDKEGCIVWCLHHLSKNPTDVHAREDITGGKNVKHYSKVMLVMKKFDAIGASNYRKITLVRFYNKEGWKEERYAVLTNRGFEDATQEAMESSKEEAKRARRTKK